MKIKSFAQAFSKACSFQRQSPTAEPLVALRRERNTLYFLKRRRVEKHSSGMFFVGNPRRGFPEK